MRQVGFIGLGRMGNPMARRLLQAGYRLVVHNRTRARADPLLREGALWAASPAEAAAEAEVVVVMVSDSEASREVVAGPWGVLGGARQGCVVANTSTISPRVSLELARAAGEKGVGYLDAPVVGSVLPASRGELVVYVGGEGQALERARDVLEVFGEVRHVGGSGMGLAVKLAVNLLLGVGVHALGEAFSLATRSGLEPGTFWQLVQDLPVLSQSQKAKGPLVVKGEFPTNFALKHMEKDLALALELARTSGAATPLAAAAHQGFLAARAAGLGEADYSAVGAWIMGLEGKGRLASGASSLPRGSGAQGGPGQGEEGPGAP